MHAYERVHPVKAGVVTVYPISTVTEGGEGGSERGSRRAADVYQSFGYGPVHVVQGHAGGMQAER